MSRHYDTAEEGSAETLMMKCIAVEAMAKFMLLYLLYLVSAKYDGSISYHGDGDSMKAWIDSMDATSRYLLGMSRILIMISSYIRKTNSMIRSFSSRCCCCRLAAVSAQGRSNFR